MLSYVHPSRLRAFRRLAWVALKPSDRNHWFAVDERGLKEALKAEDKQYGLCFNARYAMHIDRRKFTILIQTVGLFRAWQQTINFLNREGLNNFLATLVMDSEAYSNAWKLKSPKARLARFGWSVKNA